MKAALILAAVGLALFLLFQGLFGSRTVTWNQRLTLVIERPQGDGATGAGGWA
jgi:heme A synthase